MIKQHYQLTQHINTVLQTISEILYEQDYWGSGIVPSEGDHTYHIDEDTVRVSVFKADPYDGYDETHYYALPLELVDNEDYEGIREWASEQCKQAVLKEKVEILNRTKQAVESTRQYRKLLKLERDVTVQDLIEFEEDSSNEYR